jgi:hypothetical protein
MIVRLVNMGVIVDHHCLEVVVRLVNMGVIVDHHCLEVVVRLVNMGVIVDHHCVEVVVGLVGIGRIVSHHCLYFLVRVMQKINEKRISFKCLKAQQTGIYKIYHNVCFSSEIIKCIPIFQALS